MKMIMIKEETLDHLLKQCLDSLVLHLDEDNVPYRVVDKEVREMCDKIKNTAIS